MADILIDVEVKGQNSVISAVKGISTLQNNVKLLSNAFKSGSLSPKQYYKGIKQLADASNKSEKELRKYAKTLRAEEKETKKAAAAAKAYASARREALEMDRRITAERLKSANAARMQASEEERLKSKFVQGHTAMNIYSKELNDLAQARQLEIITIDEQTEAVQKLNLAKKNGTGVFNSYGNGLVGATKKTSRMGVVAQQTGYQVGDFLVQIQSGANPMMAFGQQATQLVGVMGLFKGKMLFAGAALGIIIPLVTAVAGYFWAASKAAKESAEEVDKQADALKRTNDELSAFLDLKDRIGSGKSDNVRVLTEQFNDLTKKIENAKAVMEDMDADGPQAATRSKVEASIVEYKNQQLDLAESIRVEGERQQFNADSELQSLRDKNQLIMLENLGHKETSLYLKVKAEQQKAAFATETNRRDINEEIKRQLIAHYNAMVDSQTLLDQSAMDAEKAADELERAQKAAGGIAGIDFSNIANGATWASSLADQLERARRDAADKAAGGNVDFFDPRGRLVGSANAGRITRERAVPEENRPGYVPPVVKGSSGDGASAGEKVEDYLRKLTLENELKRKSIGLSEEAARILEIITELEKKKQPIDKERIALIAKEEMATQALIEKNKEYLSYVEATGEQFRAFGESLIDGTTSIEDAFKGLLNNILKSIWDKMVGDPLADLGEKVGSFIFKSVFGSANGNVFSNGSHVQAFANGGVVGGPTMFPMNGGKTGLMGEAGPEAIMPLKRGANGKLGVQMEGGGATQVTQVFNINGNGDEYIMGKIKQAAPAIQEATKASIVQDRRRGGTMKQAFRG